MPAQPIVPEDLRTKLSRIRGLVLDVDGVLTDGSMTFDEDGREWKTFDVKDGMGLVLMRDLGYRIGIVSSRTSRVVEVRRGSRADKPVPVAVPSPTPAEGGVIRFPGRN